MDTLGTPAGQGWDLMKATGCAISSPHPPVLGVATQASVAPLKDKDQLWLGEEGHARPFPEFNRTMNSQRKPALEAQDGTGQAEARH